MQRIKRDSSLFKQKMKKKNKVHSNAILVDTKFSNRRNTPKEQTDGILVQFCQKSTIHGVNYFFSRDRHWIERLWWIVAFLVSVYLCISFIYLQYLKHIDDTFMLTVSHAAKSIGEIPFPAVTICPMTKFSTKKLNYTDIYRHMFKMDGNESRTLTEDELKMMKVAGLLCSTKFSTDVLNYFPNDSYSDDSIIKMIYDSAPTLPETLVVCHVFNNSSGCNETFSPFITENGLCFTFNGFNLEDLLTDEFSDTSLDIPYNQPRSNWRLDDGYNESISDEEAYPRRVFGTGRQFSLIVVLRINNEYVDPLCDGEVQGFNVIIHPPNEDPQTSKQFFQISPGKEVSLGVNPSLITTSLYYKKKFSLETRQCYFALEKKLRFYRKYTQRNCEAECLINTTLLMCGCAKLSMIKSSEINICGPAKIECCNKVSNNFLRNGVFQKCKCLPSCNSIVYDVATSQADYDTITPFLKSRFNYDLKNARFSRLIISFKEEVFVPSKRTEFNTITDFIANSGGLCGLFLGASVLSFVELFYYLTMRAYFTYRQKLKMHRKKSTNPRRHPIILP